MKSFGSSPKILNVVIDEQAEKPLNQDALDTLENELSLREFLKPALYKTKSNQRVFKDYLLSPKPFKLETSSN